MTIKLSAVFMTRSAFVTVLFIHLNVMKKIIQKEYADMDFSQNNGLITL